MEPIFNSLKNCLLSQEKIEELKFFANSIANFVFPTAVGPAMIINNDLFILIIIN